MAAITWPSTATKAALDSASDDPKLARAEMAELVDKHNSLVGQLKARGNTAVDTLADLRTLSGALLAGSALLLGHTSAGDGGAGDFVWDAALTTADNGGTVVKPASISSGSPGRWVRQTGGLLTPQMFGAKADGSTDDSAAIQAALDVLSTNGGCLHLPQGIYLVGTKLTLSEPVQEGIGTATKVSIKGLGGGASILKATGLADYVLDVQGEVISLHQFEGFGLEGDGTVGGKGWNIDDVAWMSVRDVVVHGFENVGVNLTDVLTSTFYGLICRSNGWGLDAAYADGSRPNAMNFIGCEFGMNREYGAHFAGPTTLNWFGGAVEGNGIGRTDPLFGWGIKLTNSGVEGSVGANFYGVYFELNAGIADIYIDQAANDCAFNVYGSTFNRIDSTDYVTNNIFAAVGALRVSINTHGCGFKGFGSYVPSAARRYVETDGTAELAANVNFTELGNMYGSDLEKPALQGPIVNAGAMAFAECRFTTAATPVVSGAYNVASVAKNAVGDYTITYQRAAAGAANKYYVGTDTAIVWQRAAETTASVRIQFRNFAGTLVDPGIAWIEVRGGR